jgi:hypothetical protein
MCAEPAEGAEDFVGQTHVGRKIEVERKTLRAAGGF